MFIIKERNEDGNYFWASGWWTDRRSEATKYRTRDDAEDDAKVLRETAHPLTISRIDVVEI